MKNVFIKLLHNDSKIEYSEIVDFVCKYIKTFSTTDKKEPTQGELQILIQLISQGIINNAIIENIISYPDKVGFRVDYIKDKNNNLVKTIIVDL